MGILLGLRGTCGALSSLKQQQEAKSWFENMVNPLSPGSAVTGLLKHESRTFLLQRLADPQHCCMSACCSSASADVLLLARAADTLARAKDSKAKGDEGPSKA